MLVNLNFSLLLILSCQPAKSVCGDQSRQQQSCSDPAGEKTKFNLSVFLMIRFAMFVHLTELNLSFCADIIVQEVKHISDNIFLAIENKTATNVVNVFVVL